MTGSDGDAHLHSLHTSGGGSHAGGSRAADGGLRAVGARADGGAAADSTAAGGGYASFLQAGLDSSSPPSQGTKREREVSSSEGSEAEASKKIKGKSKVPEDHHDFNGDTDMFGKPRLVLFELECLRVHLVLL